MTDKHLPFGTRQSEAGEVTLIDLIQLMALVMGGIVGGVAGWDAGGRFHPAARAGLAALSAAAGALLGVVLITALMWILAMLVLVREKGPRGLYNFLRGRNASPARPGTQDGDPMPHRTAESEQIRSRSSHRFGHVWPLVVVVALSFIGFLVALLMLLVFRRVLHLV